MSFLKATGSLLPGREACEVKAFLSAGFRLELAFLEPWLLRVALVPAEGLEVDRTWMIAPDGDTPWAGRDRLDLTGFSQVKTTIDEDSQFVSAQNMAVRMDCDPLRLTFYRRSGQEWKVIAADRQTGAYQWFASRNLCRHLQARGLADRHYGLGDKTGPLDRTGRRFRCLQTDSLGYNAELSDPLYKHAPFLISDAESGAAGWLYDSLGEIAFDVGAEHSNYHPHYRHVDVQEKGLVYYLIDGPLVRDVVPRLARLTGMAHLPPRWSFGFAFTTMHHADADDAQAVITGFADTCRTKNLPISAIHSGSGYTTGSDGLRYVFTWNEKKFPDREAFFAHLGELGFFTVANIKPVLLKDHPFYHQAAESGWFVQSGEGGPAVEMFWGGWGSSLDFTNPDTIEWWISQVTTAVLESGFTGGWNDNNEAELWNERATVDGFGERLPAMAVRPVHALLMTRATFEATREARPGSRPYTVSRAGPIGIARYGETWSGDNFSNWHSLKWNLRNGLSLALSGMPFVGHDIGGFDGPKPGPELFLRWVQMMALHPRAVMNSWKPQLADPVNLPWMHESVFEEVKQALRLRYRFLPYLYSLCHHCHRTGTPPIAPLFYHFDESQCRDDYGTFMLGQDVLVAPVTDPGRTAVSVYLPKVEGGWHDLFTGAWLEGGQMADVDAPLDTLPILVRSGAVLPLATAWRNDAPHDAEAVEMTLFASGRHGRSNRRIFFDDGKSWRYLEDDASMVELRMQWNGDGVECRWRERMTGRGRPDLQFALRDRENRALLVGTE